MEDDISVFAALDVSQEKTAICVVDAGGVILTEAKVATCPEAISAWLGRWSGELEKVGVETGPLTVWLWNAVAAKGLPIVVLDARHASAATEDDAQQDGPPRRPRTGADRADGWYKEVRIKSHGAYVIRALLTARDALIGIRVRLENGIRGLLKTFGVMFGTRVGGFMRRAEEIIAEELAIAPELRPIFEALVAARRAILERIRMLDAQLRAVARKSRVVRLFMTAPGIGPITALAVATAFDDAARFPRSSCAGAYLGLTPKRYESGEIS